MSWIEKGRREKRKGSGCADSGWIVKEAACAGAVVVRERVNGKEVWFSHWMAEFSTISGGEVVTEARRNWWSFSDRTGISTVSTAHAPTMPPLFRSTTTATSLSYASSPMPCSFFTATTSCVWTDESA